MFFSDVTVQNSQVGYLDKSFRLWLLKADTYMTWTLKLKSNYNYRCWWTLLWVFISTFVFVDSRQFCWIKSKFWKGSFLYTDVVKQVSQCPQLSCSVFVQMALKDKMNEWCDGYIAKIVTLEKRFLYLLAPPPLHRLETPKCGQKGGDLKFPGREECQIEMFLQEELNLGPGCAGQEWSDLTSTE